MTEKVMEKIVRRDNLNLTYRKVRSNGGSPGIDGMTVEKPCPAFKSTAKGRGKLLVGAYKPSPV